MLSHVKGLNYFTETDKKRDNLFDVNRTQCCEASPDAFKDNLRECFPISTANDPVYRRRCIPFLRSAPIPPLPGKPGTLNK